MPDGEFIAHKVRRLGVSDSEVHVRRLLFGGSYSEAAIRFLQ